MLELSNPEWAAQGPRGPLAPPRKPDNLIVAVHGDILDTWKKNMLRSVVGRTYPPRATDAGDARFETCCSTLAGLPVEGVFRAGGYKEPHMHPSGQVGRFEITACIDVFNASR